MRLPTNYKTSAKVRKNYRFKGINRKSYDPNYLYDAVNLTGIFGCKTRQARWPAMLLNSYPDQIIPCDNRLYFRYGNTLKEIICNGKALLESTTQFKLRDFTEPPDRILILIEDTICVLPDGIQLCDKEENWNLFASEYSVSSALPFVDSRTLFYSNGFSGTEPCDEAYLLKSGDKVRFSWLEGEEFTIISADEAYSYSSDAEMYEGIRVVLDKPVPSWNALPSGALMKYSTPKNRNLLSDIKLGFHEQINFSGNELSFFHNDIYYHYDRLFLKQLHIGQAFSISGSGMEQNNKTVHIKEIYDHSICFEETFLPYTEEEGNEITLTPIIPNLDFAVMIDDRIIGVDNSTKSFWISRYKEPFVFHKVSSNAEDSWRYCYDNEVTGMTVFKDSVICFQSDGGFRLFGSNALNFSTTKLPISGIEFGCGKSLARVNDALFYSAQTGIMKYSASGDSIISLPLPDNLFIKYGAGYKGNYYALADKRLWVYNTDKEIWWSESGENINEVFTAFGNLYFCTKQTIYCADGGSADIKWQLQTHELSDDEQCNIKPIACKLKINSETNCKIDIYMKKCGDLIWQSLATHSISGEKTIDIPLNKSCCEGFYIKVCGIGKASIEKMQIDYRRIR